MTSLEKAARAVAFVTADHKHTSDEWWDSLTPDEQTCAFDIARAVLLAVREPEENALKAARDLRQWEHGLWSEGCVTDTWPAMIDQILQEKGDG